MTFSDISNKKFKGHLKKMFGNILKLLNVQYFYEIHMSKVCALLDEIKSRV